MVTIATRAAEHDKLALSSILGELVEPFSEEEEADYFACEQVVASGWQSFVQVGLALARIRDGRLYRAPQSKSQSRRSDSESRGSPRP